MFLAQHGVRSLAIERRRNVLQLPRAAFFHMRTIELFRSCGIEAEVRAQSEKEFTPEGAVVAVESLAGKQIAAFIPSLNEGVDAVSPCRRLFVTQPGLEPILTLLCSDLFHQIGDVEPLTSADVVGRSHQAMKEYQAGILADYVPYTPLTAQNLKKLADLKPKTLAIMHGSSFTGDCARALDDLNVALREVFGPQK
jgi:hypothetical protein